MKGRIRVVGVATDIAGRSWNESVLMFYREGTADVEAVIRIAVDERSGRAAYPYLKVLDAIHSGQRMKLRSKKLDETGTEVRNYSVHGMSVASCGENVFVYDGDGGVLARFSWAAVAEVRAAVEEALGLLVSPPEQGSDLAALYLACFATENA